VDATKSKLFAYCLIILLPIVAVTMAMYLFELFPIIPRDEWMQMFIAFIFGCLMSVIFIWRELRR
jgi:hypothetical protein